MGLPDFICIGAHKAATTWLSRNLSRHPDIWLPFTKELHFFDPPVDGSARYWRRLLTSKLESGIARAREKGNAARLAYLEGLKGEDFILTEAWYRKVFAPKPEGKITGDFTPRYATLPEPVIDSMLALAPHARFIYLIRDPVDRAISNFRMHIGREATRPDDAEEIERLARAWVERRAYNSSDYADFIPRWDARLDEEKLLYLPFGRVKSEPLSLLREVEHFLGISAFDGYPRMEDRVNRTIKLDLPAWLRGHLEEDLAPHRAFIERRFPPEFARMIS